MRAPRRSPVVGAGRPAPTSGRERRSCVWRRAPPKVSPSSWATSPQPRPLSRRASTSSREMPAAWARAWALAASPRLRGPGSPPGRSGSAGGAAASPGGTEAPAVRACPKTGSAGTGRGGGGFAAAAWWRAALAGAGIAAAERPAPPAAPRIGARSESRRSPKRSAGIRRAPFGYALPVGRPPGPSRLNPANNESSRRASRAATAEARPRPPSPPRGSGTSGGATGVRGRSGIPAPLKWRARPLRSGTRRGG